MAEEQMNIPRTEEAFWSKARRFYQQQLDKGVEPQYINKWIEDRYSNFLSQYGGKEPGDGFAGDEADYGSDESPGDPIVDPLYIGAGDDSFYDMDEPTMSQDPLSIAGPGISPFIGKGITPPTIEGPDVPVQEVKEKGVIGQWIEKQLEKIKMQPKPPSYDNNIKLPPNITF